MNSTLIATIIAACLFGAVALGIPLRRVLPEEHFNVQTRRDLKDSPL
jgi:hypothetical protein